MLHLRIWSMVKVCNFLSLILVNLFGLVVG